MIPTDTNGLLRDAGGARPRDELDELDGLIERLRSVSCILTPECDEHKTVREAAAALIQLRDSEALVRGKIVEQMIEIARLTKLETECWSNPEAWMKWCDVRVLERA